jgi:ribonuclease R
VIQRLLFNEQDLEADLTSIAQSCSEKERLSMRAENSVVLLKKLRLAAAAFAEDPDKLYTATITRVKPFAVFFELAEFSLEGSIHVSELGKDYFEYNPKTLTFRGSRSGRTYSCGMPISIRLNSVDLIRQNAKWEISSPRRK